MCCKCKRNLSESAFGRLKRSKDGLQYSCKECSKKYRRQHYLNNKEAYVAKAKKWNEKTIKWYRDYKRTLKCIRCGEDDIACIQFHHINGEKEDNIAYLAFRCSKKKLLKELEKCVPLCANCHAKIHYYNLPL